MIYGGAQFLRAAFFVAADGRRLKSIQRGGAEHAEIRREDNFRMREAAQSFHSHAPISAILRVLCVSALNPPPSPHFHRPLGHRDVLARDRIGLAHEGRHQRGRLKPHLQFAVPVQKWFPPLEVIL